MILLIMFIIVTFLFFFLSSHNIPTFFGRNLVMVIIPASINVERDCILRMSTWSMFVPSLIEPASKLT